ncbi:leucyl/phenylalanyl-tRNA--protein transferase [Polycladidibacter stylochi]|uniref:leucyl/phenylalanyl-tRNA--protein transferase n=1 Tax=Polycladidibacter stylochi TaxID=1807766 RepID=UPI00082E73FD|nr:leucyl/phenylalanyl-tRNA--protein transferase [Pseudovibrio stylochi]
MAADDSQTPFKVTPQILLNAYACGVFPMAESANAKELFWLQPEQRGVIPLDQFHIPRRLARTIRSDKYIVQSSTDFEGVINGCSAPAPNRQSTWINDEIRSLYKALFLADYCHTIEVYENNVLVGGLYGVTIGGAFFGESMFSKARDASKVALVHLVARLKLAGFTLLDTQFITDHLTQFGTIEIPQEEYLYQLDCALKNNMSFPKQLVLSGQEALAAIAT